MTPKAGCRFPRGIERWILAGTSLSLSYTEGRQGSELFHNTLIEPTAYEHFRTTGTFRDGTMLALLLQPQGEGVLPARGGSFADTRGFLEMAVKDSSRPSREQGASSWAYYNFGTRNSNPSNSRTPSSSRTSATPMPARSCQSCHDQHAAYDNVFLQFYPLLAHAAPEGSPAQVTLASSTADPARTPATQESQSEGMALALGGLDPVLLVDGRSEEGKAELEMQHAGYRYRFVSEPSRSRFAEKPEQFKIQNQTCPVIPGAPINPALVSVHREKILRVRNSRLRDHVRGRSGLLHSRRIRHA